MCTYPIYLQKKAKRLSDVLQDHLEETESAERVSTFIYHPSTLGPSDGDYSCPHLTNYRLTITLPLHYHYRH